jgi:hypothetical protein
MTLVVAFLLLPAGAAGLQGRSAAGPDRVVLVNGTVVRGRVLSVDEQQVVVAFDFGGRVEFRRRDVRSVHRAEPSAQDDAQPEPAEAATSDRRFLVYHGDTLVGFRRLAETRCRRLGHAGVLLEEEVSFHDTSAEKGRSGPVCKVVTLEFRSESGELRTLYYREVGMGTDSIVDAKRRGNRLEYTWLRGGRRSYHEEAMNADVQFPLAWWREAAELAGRAPGEEIRGRVWDPRERRVVPVVACRHRELSVAVGAARRRVIPIRMDGPRGRLSRWLSPEGRTLKEQLNGVSLLAIATDRSVLPSASAGASPPDGPERDLLNVRIDARTGLSLRTPGSGWTDSPDARPDAVFTLVNRELRSWLAVYWGGVEGPWPGPEPPSGTRAEPVNFGGWPGEGWRVPVPGAQDRETVVRRLTTRVGRVTAELETPADLAPAVLLDYAAVLRSIQVPGRKP